VPQLEKELELLMGTYYVWWIISHTRRLNSIM
jgi:hypothetical protein